MDGKRFTIMTYNVHSCIGGDSKSFPHRIADVIMQSDPDIVALQELDVRLTRTGSIDQAHLIAKYLEMDYHFHPALRIEEGHYGNAILSRFPMRLIRAGELPHHPSGHRRYEKRGALLAEIEIHGRKVHIMNTHLGLTRRERLLQAGALLGSEWRLPSNGRIPLVMCGDFNTMPGSSVYRLFRSKLLDAQCCNGHSPKKTFSSRYPLFRIDHVFTTSHISVRGIEVPRTKLTRLASDHLPLIARLIVQ
ncbi:MAG: endonuclease/exonuclease/phosphatase family protein [bacterium]